MTCGDMKSRKINLDISSIDILKDGLLKGIIHKVQDTGEGK